VKAKGRSRDRALAAVDEVDRPARSDAAGGGWRPRPLHRGAGGGGSSGPSALPLHGRQAKRLKNACDRGRLRQGRTDARRPPTSAGFWRLTTANFLTTRRGPAYSTRSCAGVQGGKLGLEGRTPNHTCTTCWLYEKGSFFLTHRDGEKLVRPGGPTLSSSCRRPTRGASWGRHEGEERVTTWPAGGAQFPDALRRFYAELRARGKPLRSGHRLCSFTKPHAGEAGGEGRGRNPGRAGTRK